MLREYRASVTSPGNCSLLHGTSPQLEVPRLWPQVLRLCFSTWDYQGWSVSAPREDITLDFTGDIGVTSPMTEGTADVAPEPHSCIVTNVFRPWWTSIHCQGQEWWVLDTETWWVQDLSCGHSGDQGVRAAHGAVGQGALSICDTPESYFSLL